MITPGKIYPGTTLSLTAAFTDATGAPADPATVVFKTYSPCGKLTAYTYGSDDNVSKASTGNYAAAIVADLSGRWRTRWEGTDATGSVIVVEDDFNVQASRFVHPDYCDYPFAWDYL
jgi:hypothetical protein